MASSIKYRKGLLGSQHGFTKGKSHLSNPVAFFDDKTESVEEGRAEDTVYLDFSKTVSPSSHSVLTDKPIKYKPNKWTVSQEDGNMSELLGFKGCGKWHTVQLETSPL